MTTGVIKKKRCLFLWYWPPAARQCKLLNLVFLIWELHYQIETTSKHSKHLSSPVRFKQTDYFRERTSRVRPDSPTMTKPGKQPSQLWSDQARILGRVTTPSTAPLWQWTEEKHCHRSFSLQVPGERHVHTAKFLRRAPDAHCGKDMEAGLAEVAVSQGHPLTPQEQGYTQHSLCSASAAKAVVFIFSVD